MIRGWIGGFDGIGAYSARNHTETEMISWREALVPISIFCNPVLWFLVGFLLISCCRDEKGSWQCPCRPRRAKSSESTKTSATNISTLNHGSSGGLSSQLDLELGLRLTGGGDGSLRPWRSGSLRQPAGAGGRARRVARARSAQLLSAGPPRPLPNSASSAAVPLHSWRGSSPKLSSARVDVTGEPPPYHILVTPAELHDPPPAAAAAADAAAPAAAVAPGSPQRSTAGLAAPARPLRRSLDDRMMRPRPSRHSLEERRSWQPEGDSGPEGEWRGLLRHESGQEVRHETHTGPRHALLQQHVRHISLLKLPLAPPPPRPRPLSLHESQLHLQSIPLEMSPLFHSSPQERPPMYQPSPQREQPATYHSLQRDQPATYHSLQRDQPAAYHSLQMEQSALYQLSPRRGDQSPLYQPSPQKAHLELAAADDRNPHRAAAGPGSPLSSAALNPSALYRLSVVAASPSDPPGRPQRVSLQEVRLPPAAVPSAPRRPQRVSLQEPGVHGAAAHGRRRDRKCGVFGHHPAAQGRPWSLALDELTEK